MFLVLVGITIKTMKVQMQIAVALIAVLLLIEQCTYFELHFVICTNDFYNKK